jgi:hypothetical protein
MFPQRNIHKYTWTPSDGKTDNRTDHILTDKDVRVYFSGQWIAIQTVIWWRQKLMIAVKSDPFPKPIFVTEMFVFLDLGTLYLTHFYFFLMKYVRFMK